LQRASAFDYNPTDDSTARLAADKPQVYFLFLAPSWPSSRPSSQQLLLPLLTQSAPLNDTGHP
jgi:hypothetical protein